MYVRPLTSEDKVRIKQVKEVANRSIKEQSKELTKKITKARKNPGEAHLLRLLEKERYHLQQSLIKGSPVTVRCLGDNILLDYDLLIKIYRSLAKHRTVIAKIEDGDLVISYRKGNNRGCVTLREVALYKNLCSLVVIDLYGVD